MRADRLVSIVMLLQSRGKMTTKALAHELEVSRRTILRDIDALSIAGVPLYTEGGHGGGVALDENYRTTLTGLNEAEAQAIFLSSNHKLLQDIGLGEAETRTRRKLSAALPRQHQHSVDHIQQRIYIDPLWWWHDNDAISFWSELQLAVYQDRRVEVVYEKFNGETSIRILEPYSLVAKASHWYLIAKRCDDAQNELRIYRVLRLQKVTLLDEHFERALDFDLPTYWHENMDQFVNTFSSYEFTLRIHPDRINWVRRIAPGRSQIQEEMVDGWLQIRIQMDTMDLAKMLVFGLGNQCEIIEPPDLRDAVRRTCEELL